jgi:hypothetical protein
VTLEQRGRLARVAAFSRHYAAWAWWNGALLTLGATAKNFGVSRSGGALQHAEAERLVAADGRSPITRPMARPAA